MYTSRYKKCTLSRRAEEELERRIAETPEEAWERFCAVTGFEPVDEVEGEGEDDPEDTDPLGPPAYFEDLPRRPVRYQKDSTPSLSLSTRKGQGQRAKLVYNPKKKHRYPIDGLDGPQGYEFSSRLKARRGKLPTPRSARFSKTVDLDWGGTGVLGHRQLSVFLGDLSGYDNVLGFALLQRRQQYTERSSFTRRRRPLLYQQDTVPFYYMMQEHREVFHRSWSHAVRAANVVKAHRQSLVWPDIPWRDKVDGRATRNSVELCRTPIGSVKVHYEDGTAQHSIPHDDNSPTAYEVVELVCEPAAPEKVAIHKPGKKAHLVQNQTRYTGVPRYFLKFKRVAYDSDGEELPVSFMGYTRGLTLPVDTVAKITATLPDWFDEVRSYFAENPTQTDLAPYYQKHPNPLLRRWGFHLCDELRSGAEKMALTFTSEREEAYLGDKTLYEGDCPRHLDNGAHGTALRDLHPLYVARLASMAAGELLWRTEWAVDETQAYEDLQALQRFTEVVTAASVFVYAFCPALVHVFLDRTQRHRFKTHATRVRQSVGGTKLIKLRFCRGPPSSL